MLRTLALILAVASPVVCAAQSDVKDLDALDARVRQAVETARLDGASLRERLRILEEEFDLPDGLRDLGVKSLQNEQARALLNLPAPGEEQVGDAGEERYVSDVFVLASFSMPVASLKALLFDASAMGVPVVFRGFVNGSIEDTEAAVRSVYSEDDRSQGFTIDPTLFERFNVNAVPVVISLGERIDVCETEGCAGDPVPVHDRVTGNISLRAALDIIARGNGDAPGPARGILEDHP